MKTTTCADHAEVELCVIVYCPACPDQRRQDDDRSCEDQAGEEGDATRWRKAKKR